jgi:hypothetical protein
VLPGDLISNGRLLREPDSHGKDVPHIQGSSLSLSTSIVSVWMDWALHWFAAGRMALREMEARVRLQVSLGSDEMAQKSDRLSYGICPSVSCPPFVYGQEISVFVSSVDATQ